MTELRLGKSTLIILIVSTLVVLGFFGFLVFRGASAESYIAAVCFINLIIPAWLVALLLRNSKNVLTESGGLIALSFVYCLTGWIGLITTSGGWMSLFMITYGAFFFGGLFLITAVLFLIPAPKDYVIPTGFIVGLLSLHILALLFNVGDNGDGPGCYTFLDTLFGSHRDSKLTAWSIPLKGAYLAYVLLMLVWVFPQSGSKKINWIALRKKLVSGVSGIGLFARRHISKIAVVLLLLSVVFCTIGIYRQSQFAIGLNYAKGRGVPQNYKKAIRYFEIAAAWGHSGAQINLGVMNEQGLGVAKNFYTAMEWYRQAANWGRPEAQHRLWQIYYKGDGVPVDGRVALKWLQEAANQQYPPALYDLGVLNLQGSLVFMDYKRARELFKQAAEKGDVNAQNALKTLNLSEDQQKKDAKDIILGRRK